MVLEQLRVKNFDVTLNIVIENTKIITSSYFWVLFDQIQAVGDFVAGKKQTEELIETVDLSKSCEAKYREQKKNIEQEIQKLIDLGMKPEEAAVKVLSNAKTAVGGVVLAGRISVGAVDIIEGAFQVSFPGNFYNTKISTFDF